MTHSQPTPQTASHGDGAHQSHPNYLAIFGILILLTVASVIADSVGGSRAKLLVGLIVLVIASFKAMFVMLYFMHLKFEGAWKYVLLAPTMILALAIPAALAPDIAFKYYDAQNPQQRALREMEAEHAAVTHGHAGDPATEDQPHAEHADQPAH